MFRYWLLFFPSTSRKPSTSCCFIGISLAPTRQKKCLLDGALGYSWYNNKLVAIHKIPTVTWGNSLYWPPSKVLAQLWVGKCLSTSNLFWWCRSQRIYHSNQSLEKKLVRACTVALPETWQPNRSLALIDGDFGDLPNLYQLTFLNNQFLHFIIKPSDNQASAPGTNSVARVLKWKLARRGSTQSTVYI